MKTLRELLSRLTTIGAVGAALAWAQPAAALQPLDAFVTSAKSKNPDGAEARALVRQRDAEMDVATGRLLPSLTVTGQYTRNQYEAIANFGGQQLTIQAQDGLDAFVTLAVPVVDVAGWQRRAAARALLDAQIAGAENTELAVERAVTRAYYQLVGSESLLSSAKKSLDLSQSNLDLVKTRRDLGVATELDFQRATADVARAKQDVATAEQSVANARRDIETVSGLAPDPLGNFPEDDLHDEPPIGFWLTGKTDDLVAVRLATVQTYAQAKNRDAAVSAWFPTVSGQFQERFTNAGGFAGRNAYFTITAVLTWRFDFTIAPNVRAQNAALDAATAREMKARRAAEDQIHQAYNQVVAGIERARAARAQVTATALALQLASERYGAGTATQLDVTQAQRDAFSAEVARISADADLAFARVALRLATRRAGAKETDR
jgi:outer membrane protein